MDAFAEIRSLVIRELETLCQEGQVSGEFDSGQIAIERPRDPDHGEVSTNAAMVIARSSGMAPRELAVLLASRLRSDRRVDSVTIAGPGFLNMVLDPGVWRRALGSVLAAPDEFGRVDRGRGKRINLEFVSANPTGPLHVAHARGAVFGDALGRLLEFAGYDVTREYYVNDGGAQVDTLARSAYLRYLEATGERVEIPPDAYRGEYLIGLGQSLKEEFGNSLVGRPESEWIELIRVRSIDAMMAIIRDDLSSIGVSMDVFFSEKSLFGSGRIEAAIEALQARDLVIEGVLEPPRGKQDEEWEPRRQTLFRSTRHGDDTDRPIRKSDGSWTYFAADIAYHFDKVSRGYDELINVFGSDHGGYVKRIKAVVSAFSDGKMPFDIKLSQIVRVVDGGKARKMSKRMGQFVELHEAVAAVGKGVTRFVMLMRRNDAPLDFDFQKVREQSRENPVFYVQYAHARVCSLVNRALKAGLPADDEWLAGADLDLLCRPEQIALARRVGEWPRQVEIAIRHHEPHRIAFFLHELASEFHSVWTRGNGIPELRFVQEEDDEGTRARIALARGVGVVISTGLGILGIEPLKEMRG